MDAPSTVVSLTPKISPVFLSMNFVDSSDSWKSTLPEGWKMLVSWKPWNAHAAHAQFQSEDADADQFLWFRGWKLIRWSWVYV